MIENIGAVLEIRHENNPIHNKYSFNFKPNFEYILMYYDV